MQAQKNAGVPVNEMEGGREEGREVRGPAQAWQEVGER